MNQKMIDQRWMKKALELASLAQGLSVHPNPLVGAVLLRGSQVVGRGYHRAFGQAHAEVEALYDAVRQSSPSRLPSPEKSTTDQKILAIDQSGFDFSKCTLYVNLEPCAHHGKTPPCVDLLLRKKVHTVVIGTLDPNPKVAGLGVARLRRAGLSVRLGVLASECQDLNRYFFYWMVHKRPYLIYKSAQSLDGKIALPSGQSRWISCPEARVLAHQIRAEVDAVLVGAGTVRQDNPRLTVRLPGLSGGWIQPYRVVLTAELNLSKKSKIFSRKNEKPVILLVDAKVAKRRLLAFKSKANIQLIHAKNEADFFVQSIRRLGQMGIVSVLIEGGSRVAAHAIRSGLLNEAYLFVAPKWLGGDALPAVGQIGIKELVDAPMFSRYQVQSVGTDIMIHGWI